MNYSIRYLCFSFIVGSVSASIKSRIIGGEDAFIKDFPYQASLRLIDNHFCGGVIVSQNHVLTAAHCFTDVSIRDHIRFGYGSISVHTGTNSSIKVGRIHRVDCVTIHPAWVGTSQTGFINDIAVVRLADTIRFNENQRSIELPSRDIVSGLKGYTSGWGRTSEDTDARSSIQLQKLRMTLLSYQDCNTQLPFRIRESQLCAYQANGHGSCMGDSGGPLVVNNRIVGIISWIHGKRCASGVPEIFSNVYAHRKFIKNAMNCGNECKCVIQ